MHERLGFYSEKKKDKKGSGPFWAKNFTGRLHTQWKKNGGIMVYEVRFQTVDPARRADYVKMYKEAIQGCKAAGCRSGLILCSEDDPAAVMVLLEWPTKEHHLNWRGTPTHKSFRAAVEGWQAKPSQGGYYVAETI
jgi:heme-degrading monooxygenase HmoA